MQHLHAIYLNHGISKLPDFFAILETLSSEAIRGMEMKFNASILINGFQKAMFGKDSFIKKPFQNIKSSVFQRDKQHSQYVLISKCGTLYVTKTWYLNHDSPLNETIHDDISVANRCAEKRQYALNWKHHCDVLQKLKKPHFIDLILIHIFDIHEPIILHLTSTLPTCQSITGRPWYGVTVSWFYGCLCSAQQLLKSLPPNLAKFSPKSAGT